MKNNRHGKSAILTYSDYSKIRKQVRSKKYKLLIDLGWFTGERIGALCQLKISDCYDDKLISRSHINFKARTRKASPSGKRRTRQLKAHSTLIESLQAYKPDTNISEYIFHGRDGVDHITTRWCDKILRAAVERAGLEAKGISWHSFRRTFATRLHRSGVSIFVISKLLDHSDVRTTQEYIDVFEDQIEGAIEAL
ncbi:integrase family protein [Calothrix parasitica NIES-267]|uniref:Integrase family protein n=1 Tax=Calothrix parasitica NIES-267 TaxID=1973488 RepID=A0A1Z4LXN3_9CYAN|nr:integrase family protein [Calothrix parasitica NIES-267]